MMNEINEISIPVPWGTISGKTFGKMNSVPVLCIHGRNDNLETFSQLLPLLPPNLYYVCIDLPGHGKSSHPHIGYILDFLWYTKSVKAVVDHFKWSKIYYLGHSMGGIIGLFLTSLYPELVVKLIIIDSLLGHTHPDKTVKSLREDVLNQTLKLEQRSSISNAPVYSLEEFIRKMKATRQTESDDVHLRPIAQRNLLEVGPDQYKYTNDQRCKGVGQVHLTYEQSENVAISIVCPLLVILGNRSLVTNPYVELNVSPLRKSPKVKFHVINGDHDVHIAHPKEVARLVSVFLLEGSVSKL